MEKKAAYERKIIFIINREKAVLVSKDQAVWLWCKVSGRNKEGFCKGQTFVGAADTRSHGCG